MADLTVAGTTSYPGTLDTTTTITDGPTGSDQVAAQVNGSAAAAVAIETELGVQPRGTAATVQARLDRGVASAGTLLMTGSSLGMTLGDGDIWIGSAASNSMALSRLNAGQGLTIAHGAHSTTIAMTSLAGTTVATQAQMETATDLVNTVTAGRTQYHPGVAKFWISFYPQTATTGASHGVSSITDLGLGQFRVTFITAFSSASYAVVCTSMMRSNNLPHFTSIDLPQGLSAASCAVDIVGDLSGTFYDPQQTYLVGYGDQ